MILLFMLFSGIVNAELNDALIHWWDGDGETCVSDRVGSLNLTSNGGAGCNSSNSIDGNSYLLTSVAYFSANDSDFPSGAENRTICFSYYPISIPSTQYIFNYGTQSTAQAFGSMFTSPYIYYWTYNNDFNTNVEGITGEWNNVCLVYDGNKALSYVNGVNSVNSTTSINTVLNELIIGRSLNGINPANGYFDNFGIWERVLSYDEIEQIQNNITYPFGSEVIEIFDINLTDRTRTQIFDEINQADYFTVLFNATYNNLTNNGLLCNVTFNNITAHFDDYLSNGIIFNDTKTREEKLFNHPNDEHLNDTVRFIGCYLQGTQSEIEVYVNNVLYDTIGGIGSGIPQCNIGNQTFSIPINYSGAVPENVNLTFICDNCDSNDRFKFLQQRDGLSYEFLRDYSEHIDSYIYNSSLGLYEYQFNHLYQDFNTGIKVLTINCNGTTETFNYGVNLVNVESFIEEIEESDGTQYDLINNNFVEIEAGNNLTISNECLGGSLNYNRLINVTYSNGTLIASDTDENLFITSNQLNVNDNYLINLYCEDLTNSSNFDTISKTFSYNDTTNPTLTWNFPSDDDSSEVTVNNKATVNLICQDVNLFSFGINCKNSLGITILNYYEEDITDTAIQYINETNNITVTGLVTCIANVSDSHTLNDISKHDIQYNVNKDKELSFDSDSGSLKLSVNLVTPTKWHVVKQKDRYSFEPELETRPKTLSYSLSCDNTLHHIHHSDYNAHFVCGEFWIDFEIEGVPKKNYKVNMLQNNTASIYIHNVDKLESLKTNSIGIINTIQETVTFNVIDEVVEEEGVLSKFFEYELNSTASVLFVFMLVILYIGLLFLAFNFGNFGLGSMAFFVGMILGFMLYPVGIFITLLFFMLNIVIFIKYIINLK